MHENIKIGNPALWCGSMIPAMTLSRTRFNKTHQSSSEEFGVCLIVVTQ